MTSLDATRHPATDATDGVKRTGSTTKKTAALIAALGLACVACLIPGLAVGAAGAFAAGAIGVDEAIMGATALALLAYAITKTVRRRRAASTPTSRSGGCGC